MMECSTQASRGTRVGARLKTLGSARTVATALLAIAGWSASGAALADADLLVNQTHAPDPVPAGGQVTFMVTVSNNGPSVANAVTLTDTLPAGSTFVSATTTGGTCSNTATTVTCNWASIANLGTATTAVVVTLPTAGVWTNQAEVSSATADSTATNNVFNEQATAIAAANLALTAASSAPATGVAAGAPYAYTLHIDNVAGPNDLPAGQASTVTFAVPSGAAITAAPAAPGWSCSPASGYPLTSGTITCTRADGLAVGAAFPDITVAAVANVLGTVSTSTSVASTFPDGNINNNSATVDVTVLAGTDMSLRKTASPSGTVALGSQVTFTLTPRFEGGAAPASGEGQAITVTDTLPAALTYVSHSAPSPWACAFNAPTLTCTYPGPYKGDNFTDLPAISLVVTASTEADVTNQASVAVPGDQQSVNDIGSATITVSNKADLSIGKAPSINPVVVNQDYVYAVVVYNGGPVAVAAGQTITVTDIIPAGMTVTGAASGTGWSCTAPTAFPAAGPVALSCTYAGPLAVGANTPALNIPVRNTVAGGLTNRACVALSGTGPSDSNASNDCRGAGTTSSSTSADIQLSKSASGTVFAGEDLTYVLSVTNAGPDTASNVNLTDTLYELLATGGVQSVTPSQGTCASPAGPFPLNATSANVACNLGTLDKGASASVTIVIKPANTTTADINRTNTATARSADIGDPAQGNNTGSITSIVKPRVDVTVSKAATPAPVRVGEPLTFVVTARNDGPSAAANVRISDVMPADTTFLNLVAVSNGGTCPTTPATGSTGQTLECEWAAIPPGTQYTATFRVRPLAATLGKAIVNHVMVTTTTTETNASNNAGTVSATVIPASLDVLMNKRDTLDPIPLGTETEYTITITNAGPSYGTKLIMTDTFPSGGVSDATFAYRGGLSTAPAGTCVEPALGATSGVLTCTFPGIDTDTPVTVRYRMQALAITDPAKYSGVHFNSVSVRVDETERETANNTKVEFTTTRRDPIAKDLALTKAVNIANGMPGSTLVYTLTVKNPGTDTMSGAQVTDTLPAGLTLETAPGCTESAGTLTCPVPDLVAGASASFTVTMKIPSGYAGANPIVNTAQLTAPDDTVSTNNTASATTRIGPDEPIPVPTLGHWMLMLLSLVLAGGAVSANRRTMG